MRLAAYPSRVRSGPCCRPLPYGSIAPARLRYPAIALIDQLLVGGFVELPCRSARARQRWPAAAALWRAGSSIAARSAAAILSAEGRRSISARAVGFGLARRCRPPAARPASRDRGDVLVGLPTFGGIFVAQLLRFGAQAWRLRRAAWRIPAMRCVERLGDQRGHARLEHDREHHQHRERDEEARRQERDAGNAVASA